MSGSNTVIATETLTGGATTVSAPVARTVSGTVANNGTPTITTAIYAPVGVGVTITNDSTIEIAGTTTQDPLHGPPFYSSRYAQDVGLEMSGTLSTLINSGSIIADTELIVPANGLLAQTYVLYGLGLSALEDNIANKQGALISGSGIGAYLTASTMTNYGIVEGLHGVGNRGVDVKSSGLSNASTGTIIGGEYGVYESSPITLTNGSTLFSEVRNDGLIEATGFNGRGIGVLLAGGAFVNDKTGTIIGLGSGALGAGVIIGDNSYLGNAGTVKLAGSGVGIFDIQGVVTNQSGGYIEGVLGGTSLSQATLLNRGTVNISGTGVAAEIDNGTLANYQGGIIEAAGTAVKIGYTNGTGSVTNAGLIDATASSGIGVVLDQGSFGNAATGTIEAATAIDVTGATVQTITDAGLIESTGGASGTAISDGSGVLDLILDPGAVITGSIVTDASVANILDLASATSAGSLTGLGETITGFADISFASGASWTIEGDSAGLAAGQTISGFAQHDTIVLDSFAAMSDSFVSGIGLELISGSSTITLGLAGSFTTSDFAVTDPPTNTTIALVAPCFAEDTRILTPLGQITVQALRVGDDVVLVGGETAPITWIGRRRIDLTRHARPDAARPILIEAGAICDGMPCRDLYLSPDHALAFDGHLIPAKTLINGATIRQAKRRSVTYYHVELPEHAILLAEGVPCESYLETGNRGAFENGGMPVVLHPDLAQSLREAEGCAPFAEAGPVVEAVRARLLERAGIGPIGLPTPRLRRRPDGSLMIRSASVIPGVITPDPRDRRHLGVKITALMIGGVAISLDHPLLCEGWHDLEPDGRWTNGHAIIPAALIDGAAEVMIAHGGTAPDRKIVISQRGRVPRSMVQEIRRNPDTGRCRGH